jgi:hypothetical protein
VAKLQLVQDPAADALLDSNPFAVLVGMLLDQQVPSPIVFQERFNSYPIGEQKRSAIVELPIVRPSS